MCRVMPSRQAAQPASQVVGGRKLEKLEGKLQTVGRAFGQLKWHDNHFSVASSTQSWVHSRGGSLLDWEAAGSRSRYFTLLLRHGKHNQSINQATRLRALTVKMVVVVALTRGGLCGVNSSREVNGTVQCSSRVDVSRLSPKSRTYGWRLPNQNCWNL